MGKSAYNICGHKDVKHTGGQQYNPLSDLFLHPSLQESPSNPDKQNSMQHVVFCESATLQKPGHQGRGSEVRKKRQKQMPKVEEQDYKAVAFDAIHGLSQRESAYK